MVFQKKGSYCPMNVLVFLFAQNRKRDVHFFLQKLENNVFSVFLLLCCFFHVLSLKYEDDED